MTKEKFLQYKNEYTDCHVCGKKLPTKYFLHRYIKENGTGKCKVCDWIQRNDGLPVIDGFTEFQIKRTIDFIIYEESPYLNDLCDILHLDLTIVNNLIKSLKIGNRKYLILTNCDFCNKKIEVRLSTYLLNQNCYCSSECYWKHKPTIVGHGRENRQYNRIKTNCSNCNKNIEVIPYNYNNKNSFGDSHNFCSQECYWEFRTKYYIGAKSSNYHNEWTEEQREHMRKVVLVNSRSSKRFDSKVQLIVNSLLDKHNINYKREEIFKYYAVDNYLIDYNLIIEVMGDYWHCSPLKYNEFGYPINTIQQKDIHMDKCKMTYIKSHYNINILYLWESDILNHPNVCEDLILHYIKHNGAIENYHSFNWSGVGKNFSLNNNIVIPYQNMDIKEYRHLFK